MRVLLPFLLLTACGEPVPYTPPVDTDTGGADTDTPPGDTAEDTAPPPDTTPVSGSLTFVAFGDGAPIEGLRVTADEEIYTTEAGGLATFEVPGNSTSEVTTFLDLFLRGHIWLTTDGVSGWSRPVVIPSQSLFEALSGAFSSGYDTSLSTVFVSVAMSDGAGGWASAEGASVSLDVTAGGSFHDAGDGAFTAGGDIASGDGQWVYFVNVPVGAVNVTVEPPTGGTCTTFPSTTRFDGAIMTEADEVSVLLVTCQ